uniref:Galectin n=1 Tax=Parastrongyloides trichosuri TaxID=131310 RepID=A0A0N4ZIB7_PARTI
MHSIHNPIVPFVESINETLHPGARITISGEIAEHHHHSQDFAIELLSGPNVVFHANFRFDHGVHREHKLVLNSCFDGSWGGEIRLKNPLHHKDHFTITIEVHETHYTLGVNGFNAASFNHRVDYRTVQAIGVKGHANIEKVHFEGFNFYDGWSTNYNFGHSGYNGYGTEHYIPPEFDEEHPHRHHFHGKHRRHSQESWD